jgi:sarcosine oxidase
VGSYDVIVLGIGGWGSATLHHLARRGLKVAGVEQFAVGHHRGSSHGESRIIRMAYFMDPAYVPMLRRAYHLWRQLEEEAGETLMTLPGLLCLGEAGGSFIRGLEACYAAHDLPHERWTTIEARARFPQFHPPGDAVCYWDPLGGYLNADRCVLTHTRMAQKNGATLLTDERVLGYECEGDGVIVLTEKQELRAARLVIAAGAFVSRFAADLGGLVTPVRKALFWYHANDPAAFAPECFPVWIAKFAGLNYYGFPSLDGSTVKAAEDTGGQTLSDPNHVPRELRNDDEQNLRPFLDHLFPGALGHRSAGKVCLYENSADRHFILDRHPEHPQVIFACGGSGHGFKFASVAGEIAADLAMTGNSLQRPDLFRLPGRS